MGKLTPPRKRFADEYIIDLNGTRAYKAAYPNIKSDEAAAANAARLLRDDKVSEYVRKLMAKREKRTNVTQDKVVKELARIAFANGSDYAKVVDKPMYKENGEQLTDKDGEPINMQGVVLTPTDELTEDQKAAIACIKEGKFGIEVSTCDKVKALELLGKHLGMYTDKVDVNASGSIVVFNGESNLED